MIEIDRERYLNYLSEVISMIASSNEHQKVLSDVVDRIPRLFRCQTCAVIIIDPKTEYLRVENSTGLSHTYCKAFKSQIGTGAISELLWTGKPVVVGNSEADAISTDQVKLEHDFGSAMLVQIAVDHRTIGYLHIDSREKDMYADPLVPLLRTFAHLAGIAIIKARLHEENLRLDTKDHETGLLKYTSMLENIDSAIRRAKDLREEFALVLLDIDSFKNIEHTAGYDASRLLLRDLAALIQSKIGPADSAGRFGFDEFIILLVKKDLEEAGRIAESISKQIASTSFTPSNIKTTVSTGVVEFPDHGVDSQSLVLAVKEAMFEAQRGGRNRVWIKK